MERAIGGASQAQLHSRIPLLVVDADEAAGFTLAIKDDGPYRGPGSTDFVCGHCGKLLVIGVSRGALHAADVLIKCPCGALNRSA